MSSRRRRLRRSGQGGSNAMRIALIVLAGMFGLTLVIAVAGAAFAATTLDSWLQGLPDPDKPGAFEVAQATKIYSADGKLLARLFLENREVIPISRMSTDLVQGLVAVEDERFYRHNGVDYIGLARAVVMNLVNGFGAEGASTITQQYVRNTILLDERTEISLARKVREAYLAMELEKRYEKDEILEMYLNAVYFGEGAYGVQAASRVYFAKTADQLTLAQAATLAGLPQRPSKIDPYINPDGALRRRNEVLLNMLENDYITQEEYDQAKSEKLVLKRAEAPSDGVYYAPYFVAHVKKELQAKFSKSVVFGGGLVVRTTLDTRMQKAAEDAVRKKLPKKKDPECALVSIDPNNGYVKALVGGRNYKKSKFNLATQGKRQPGSSFKTFVLVTAIQKGMPPSFMIDSSSPAYIATKPKPWVVANSEGSGHGMMSLSSATASSVNTVYARVAWEIGAKGIAKTAMKMGIETPIPNYPSIALGTRNVSPYEMASAYGTLATGGIHHDPIVITSVTDRHGEVIFKAKKKGTRAISKEVAVAATKVLQGVVSHGTATRARIGRPVAGKTGTSQDYRDVWFVGYTPQLVTAVWVGHPTEKPIYVNGTHAFGGTVAAPIWAAYMKKAMKGMPVKNFMTAKSPKYTPGKFDIPVSKPPSVTGMKLADAEKKLKGYEYTVEHVYSDKPVGTVVGQKVKGDKLTLLVSKGPKPAPTKPTPPPSTEPSGSTNTSTTP